MVITGNRGTTHDPSVDWLNANGMVAIGYRTHDLAEHHDNLRRVLAHSCDLILDNGAELYELLAAGGWRYPLRGGTKETTSGANQLRERFAPPPFPILVFNDSPIKLTLENRRGVGQIMLEGFMRATNLMPNGKVVVGYGWCGRGVAQYFRAAGARVTVVDTDPIKALEAAMDGYAVSALPSAQIVLTVTSRPGIIGEAEVALLRDGCLLANAGHFSTEIGLEALHKASQAIEQALDGLDRYTTHDGRRLYLLAGGEAQRDRGPRRPR